MDEARFDAIARALTAVRSRRGAAHMVNGLILGGALGLLSRTYPEATEAGGKCKPKCSECSRCKRGPCRNTKHGKACKKGKCTAKESGVACSTGTCQAGVCAAPPCVGQPDNTPCPADGRCREGVCQPRPTCPAHHSSCSQNSECCSHNCSGEPSNSRCSCSQPGEPCYTTTDCCQSPAPATCIGYVCVPL
jgi:hypothetical protein